MKKLYSVMSLVGVMVIVLFGCTAESNQFSPSQIIDNSLKESERNELTYYGEAIIKLDGLNDLMDTFYLKEWRKDGNVRIELESENSEEKSTTILKGDTLTSYDEKRNQATIIEDPDLMAINQITLKDQANLILDLVRNTHDISIEGEATIIGRDTYHIVAKEKDQQTIFGDQEMWIDKETWLVLKMVSVSGDNQSESAYTLIDFDQDIADDLFTLDLPQDVDIIEMDEISEPSEVTLEEAVNDLGKPFLVFTENDGVQLANIESFNLTGILERVEISLDYLKNDLPFIILSVFEASEDTEDLGVFGGEEPITIRAQEGSYMEMGDMRSVQWVEDGLSYSIILLDPNLTVEELQTMAEEMVLIE